MRTISQYSDAELFGKLREKRPTAELAFAELYKRYAQRIYTYCRRVVGDQHAAEDIFQEACTLFFQSAQQERTMTNVPGYFMRIARNLCLQYKKKNGARMIAFEDFRFPVRDAAYENKELMQLIAATLELLPEEYEEAFVLREYNGLSYTEIAEIIGVSLDVVKVRIFRAKKKIRQILAPYLIDLER